MKIIIIKEILSHLRKLKFEVFQSILYITCCHLFLYCLPLLGLQICQRVCHGKFVVLGDGFAH